MSLPLPLLAAASALLVGLSKTGLPGVSIPAILLMTEAYPHDARLSVGAILPLLLVGDVFAVAWYRRHADWNRLARLLPYVFVGMLPGAGRILPISNRTKPQGASQDPGPMCARRDRGAGVARPRAPPCCQERARARRCTAVGRPRARGRAGVARRVRRASARAGGLGAGAVARAARLGPTRCGTTRRSGACSLPSSTRRSRLT